MCAGAPLVLHDAHAEVCARRCLLLYVLEQLKLHADGRPDASIFRAAAGGGFGCGRACGCTCTRRGRRARRRHFRRGGAGRRRWRRAARREAAARGGSAGSSGAGGLAPHGLTGARPASSAEAAAEAERGGEACAPGRAHEARARRADSSMSCSDKLARWAAIGVQGALLSLLLPRPLRLSSLSVGAPCSLPALRRAIVLRAPPPADADADAGGDDGAASLELRAVAAPLSTATTRPRARTRAATRCCGGGRRRRRGGQRLRGTRLGATKGAASPKHRASACKALLLERFRELCAALPAEALPEPLRAVGDVRRRSYRELKLAATDYQRRKDAFLGLPAFRDWVHCPPCCEEFGGTS